MLAGVAARGKVEASIAPIRDLTGRARSRLSEPSLFYRLFKIGYGEHKQERDPVNGQGDFEQVEINRHCRAPMQRRT